MAIAVNMFAEEPDRKRKRDVVESKPRKKAQLADQTQTSHIDELEAQVSESTRYYNNVARLLDLARAEVKLQHASAPATIALCRLFCRLRAEGKLALSKAMSERAVAVNTWLRGQYAEYQKLLLRMAAKGNDTYQDLSISLCMQLLKEENGGLDKAGGVFEKLVESLILSGLEDTSAAFSERYAKPYDDVRHALFKSINQTIQKQENPLQPSAITNVIALLRGLEVPLESPKLSTFFITNGKQKTVTLPSHKKLAQQAWLGILRSSLDAEHRKVLLEIATSNIIPWIVNVEILMDFFTDSYNSGGTTSLLALSGLFYLISEKNLDYPEFFLKLYSLLDDKILHSRYRSRFFRLLNTFMSSTHLPAAMVASFVKKLSRLALEAPPGAIVAIIPWVYNMLKKHPSCTLMLHRETQDEDALSDLEEHGYVDPFDEAEKDPSSTNAIESSLWELETLQSHYHPNVASLARIMSEQFTKLAYNLEDFLDHSYSTLVESELLRELKKTPVVEFEIPKQVFVQPSGRSMEAIMQMMLDRG